MFAMTFHEFAQNLFTPVQYFVSWLDSVANSLINNYIIQTLLCITIILSLFWLIYNAITNYFNSKCDEVDNYLDRKKNYELYKEIQRDYYYNHRQEEYEFLYDKSILKEQVRSGMFVNAEDLILDNKIKNYKLNANALKKIKEDSLSDNIESNDNDIDYLVPTSKIVINNKVPFWLEKQFEGVEPTEEEIKEAESLFDTKDSLDVSNNSYMSSIYDSPVAKKVEYKNIDDIPIEILRKYDMRQNLLHNVYTKDNYAFLDLDSGEIYFADDSGYIQLGNLKVRPSEAKELFNIVDDPESFLQGQSTQFVDDFRNTDFTEAIIE